MVSLPLTSASQKLALAPSLDLNPPDYDLTYEPPGLFGKTLGTNGLANQRDSMSRDCMQQWT